MAEQDDLEYEYGATRNKHSQGLDDGLFEEDQGKLDDYLDEFSDESANDDYLDDDFDEDDFISDGYDDFGDSFIDEEELGYRSTPPGAFYRACARQLRHGPRHDHHSEDNATGTARSDITQDRGPSYML